MIEAVDATQASSSFAEYQPISGHYDEAFHARGLPRAEYAELIAALEGADFDAIGAAVAADLRSQGVMFRTRSGLQAFHADPVPRILGQGEWRSLASGLSQRVRALNAFIADVYSEQAILRSGRLPREVIESARHYEPLMRNVQVPHETYATVAGLDVVRDADGTFLVLEDNLRTPSGIAYAAAVRAALDRCLPVAPPPLRQSSALVFDLLARALRGAAPDGSGDPSIALLSDGPPNSAWYEHREISRRLSIPVVTVDDLRVKAGRLVAVVEGRSVELQVVYRRTDEDRLTDGAGRLTPVGEALIEPLQRGTLACVNAFGSGIGDDKLVHAYVDEMVRFYLGDEPLLKSVVTHRLDDPATLEAVLDRLEELVVKPRTGHGGHGVVICEQESEAQRAHIAALISRAPDRYVAQETARLSLHPTVCGGWLAPRHVDLRPFVVSGGGDVAVASMALTRVALAAGSMVVNSSQRGGGKDTWVVA